MFAVVTVTDHVSKTGRTLKAFVWTDLLKDHQTEEIALDTDTRKKMKLHASFVGASGAGKTYAVRSVLQELRPLFADGAVFWVTTRSSWELLGLPA